MRVFEARTQNIFEIGSLIRDKHDLCWKKSVDRFLKNFVCVLGKI